MSTEERIAKLTTELNASRWKLTGQKILLEQAEGALKSEQRKVGEIDHMLPQVENALTQLWNVSETVEREAAGLGGDSGFLQGASHSLRKEIHDIVMEKYTHLEYLRNRLRTLRSQSNIQDLMSNVSGLKNNVESLETTISESSSMIAYLKQNPED